MARNIPTQEKFRNVKVKRQVALSIKFIQRFGREQGISAAIHQSGDVNLMPLQRVREGFSAMGLQIRWSVTLSWAMNRLSLSFHSWENQSLGLCLTRQGSTTGV